MGKVLGKLFPFEHRDPLRRWQSSAMQDDLARAERYGTRATAMRQTAEREADEKRRAALLGIASQYELLADSLLRRGSDLP